MLNAVKLNQNSRLGQLVVEKGWINEVQLSRALDYQATHHCKLGESLLQLGFLNQKQLNTALSRQRWVRSFVAGMVMVSSPICPVLAGEQNDTLQFVAQSALQDQDYNNSQAGTEINDKGVHFKQNHDFQLGFSHKFTSRIGVEIGVGNQSTSAYTKNVHSDNQVEMVPQITFFASQDRTSLNKREQRFRQNDRSDRYKDTIPAVYRLTLKGYSIYEGTDKISKYWEFDKVSDSPYKNYEIMFSFTKQF